MKKGLCLALLLLIFSNVAFAWTDLQEYADTLNDSEKNVSVNDYVYQISDFIKEKCPPEYCKHIVIIGDDFVVPLEREIIQTKNGPEVIYSDGIYNVTTNRSVGELKDILEYDTEIALIIPSSSDSQLRTAIENMKSNMASEYNLDSEIFEEYFDSSLSCSVRNDHELWNKSVIIVGEDNTLLDCSQFWKESSQIFETFQSPWGTQSNPKKQVILIKTNKTELIEDAAFILTYDNVNKNFRGSLLDTDGDGWTDEEELIAHTDPQDKFDNICTKLPGLKTLTEDLDDIDYWADMASKLLNGQITTQSILIGGASEVGKMYGMYAGAVAGARDDYKFVTADVWSLLGTVITASLNTENQAMAITFLDGVFTDSLATQCSAVKHGINIGDDVTQFYVSDVLPSIYEEAENIDPILPVILDDADRNVFNQSFVAGYHVGYISEQIAIGKGTDEALKSLKLGRLIKVAQLPEDLALGLIAKFEKALDWTNDARKGLVVILKRTTDDTIARLALEQYDSVAAKAMLENAAANTAEALAKPKVYQSQWVKFVKESTYINRRTNFGKIGENFIVDKAFIDDLIAEGLNNKSVMKKLEARLGLDPGSLSEIGERIAMVEFNDATQFGMKLPEQGTNKFFIKGGATIGGAPERLIDGGLDLTQVAKDPMFFNPV